MSIAAESTRYYRYYQSDLSSLSHRRWHIQIMSSLALQCRLHNPLNYHPIQWNNLQITCMYKTIGEQNKQWTHYFCTIYIYRVCTTKLAVFKHGQSFMWMMEVQLGNKASQTSKKLQNSSCSSALCQQLIRRTNKVSLLLLVWSKQSGLSLFYCTNYTGAGADNYCWDVIKM